MSDDARRSGRTAIAERLIIVTGKGGVGKSTVAAALGAAAAGRGLRTIVAELAGRSDVARLLGGEAADRLREVELYPGLHHVRIDRQPAFEEYLREEVPGPLPAVILSRSRVFGLFVEATPGMDQLLMIGKVWSSRNDRGTGGAPGRTNLVVLDGPATACWGCWGRRGRSARSRESGRSRARARRWTGCSGTTDRRPWSRLPCPSSWRSARRWAYRPH